MELRTSTNDVFGLILFITVVVMEISISLEQHCLPPIGTQNGFALVGKEYRTFTVEGYFACLNACREDERCMSLNYLETTKTCDLNTQTKDSQPSRLKRRPHSIYKTNTAFRTPERVKGMKELPGKSCLDILDSGESVGTGVYWIDPVNTGNPIQAYCDMTTDGGGWTIVKKTILQSAVIPSTKVISSAYELIAAYHRNDMWILPRVGAMLEILQKTGFHQIHFYCQKKSVGRVVSIMTMNNTAGHKVVQYFTTQEEASVFPPACGSFKRLPEDTSILAQNCSKWGTPPLGNKGKWGHLKFREALRLGALPFQIDVHPKYAFGGTKLGGDVKGYCDDSYKSPKSYNANDKWQISVR